MKKRRFRVYSQKCRFIAQRTDPADLSENFGRLSDRFYHEKADRAGNISHQSLQDN